MLLIRPVCERDCPWAHIIQLWGEHRALPSEVRDADEVDANGSEGDLECVDAPFECKHA